MTLLSALRLTLSSPYAFARRHEWRGVVIKRSGLWPVVTVGWWTVDTLPEIAGARVADVVETMRELGTIREPYFQAPMI